MKSAILLIALVAFASAQGIDDTEQFLEGFAIPFNLQSAANQLVTCAGSDAPEVFGNLTAAIQALEGGNFTGAIGDFVLFLHDIESLESSCQDGVDPFIQTFQPAIQAYDSNPDRFYFTVGKDLALGGAQVLADGEQLVVAIKGGNFTAAGEDFGDITKIGLDAYLNNDLFN